MGPVLRGDCCPVDRTTAEVLGAAFSCTVELYSVKGLTEISDIGGRAETGDSHVSVTVPLDPDRKPHS